MLFYNIGYAQTLTSLLTIHGSNSYQDVSQNHCNFKKKDKLVLVVNVTKLVLSHSCSYVCDKWSSLAILILLFFFYNGATYDWYR